MNNSNQLNDKPFNLIKLLLIGDSGVGKTSLLTRYTTGQFRSEYQSTIGCDFRVKNIQIKGEDVKLQLWDTAGQQRFGHISAAYYRRAAGILLIFDLSSAESFKQITSKWGPDIQTRIDTPDVPIILIGNKSQLTCQVSTDEVLLFAERNQYMYYETSAAKGTNVEQAFATIAVQSLKWLQRHQNDDKPIHDHVLKQNDQLKAPKKSCC